VILLPTVYMDQRDVTAAVDAVTVTQSKGVLYRECVITFRGWHSLDMASRWDVYASRSATVPRSEIQIRSGIIAPDREPTIKVSGKEVLATIVTVYDWAYVATMFHPSCTLVVAPDMTAAVRAVAEATDPVGRWVCIHATTLHDAVLKIAALAGFWVDIRIPNVRVSAQVMPAGQSCWDSIKSLTDPFAPNYWFRRGESRLIIADRAATYQGVGSTLVLAPAAVDQDKGITAGPTIYRTLRRVVIGVPRWL
jgi:hypothetical protein